VPPLRCGTGCKVYGDIGDLVDI